MDAQLSLLQPTRLLDFTHPDIEALVQKRGWQQLTIYERIGAVYDFVRNEIAFGYNEGDELPASGVLADGIGQCNTKSTLLMALLRAVGIPCRCHGFTIDKPLQKGAITGVAYALAPHRIIHSWVEVAFQGRWVNLEGFILDAPYWPACSGGFRADSASAATAPPRPTCLRPGLSGAVRTPTSKRKGSPMTWVSSTIPTNSMFAMARTLPA